MRKQKINLADLTPKQEEVVKIPVETKDETPKRAENTPGETPKMVETKLRCDDCSYTTPLMSREFCPICRDKTLKRVSVIVNSDGSKQSHISTRRPISKRGKKFSLPAPKGGKHAVNPRLFEDQRDAQQRISAKALARTNPMGEDYMAGSSPFVTKDITSKSAMLGLHGSGKGNAQVPGMYGARKNPNQVKKNTGNGKKK